MIQRQQNYGNYFRAERPPVPRDEYGEKVESLLTEMYQSENEQDLILLRKRATKAHYAALLENPIKHKIDSIKVFLSPLYRNTTSAVGSSVAKLSNRKKIALAGGVLLVVLALTILNNTNNRNSTTGVLGETQMDNIKVQHEEFSALAPADDRQSMSESFDDREGVASYQDDIDGQRIAVSQQIFPESLKEKSLEDIAASMGSFTTIDFLITNKGQAYVASSDIGEQVVVLNFADLLIFLTSDSTISDLAWTEYIDSLE